LLPRWRGAAPIQRAIEAGDDATGVCIMQIEETLDTGPVFHCVTTPVDARDTAGTLHDRLAAMGAQALEHCLKLLRKGTLGEPLVQDHSLATYAHKLTKAEAELDWQQPAEVLQRRVRAFNPWPVAWCELGGLRLRVWQAEVVDEVGACNPGELMGDRRSLVVGTAEKALKITELQKAGGQRMTAEQFLNAHDPQAW
jgi:methionyl-tRNA formyltransferase